MARRTGIPAITATAKELCRLLVKFDSIIRAISNNDPQVILALEAALAACSALRESLDEYIEQGV